MFDSKAIEHRTQDQIGRSWVRISVRHIGNFATNIGTLMWPMVRMKHEKPQKIQKHAHYSKPLAQKPQRT